MENVEQLWSPISMQTERETRITKAQALECLTAFIGDGSGSFRDHNTSAQLIRLQAALKEELVKKQAGTAIRVEEPPQSTAEVEAVAGKKRKRDKKKEKADTTVNGGDAGDTTVGDVTVAQDADTDSPAKKKKKKSKVKAEAAPATA